MVVIADDLGRGLELDPVDWVSRRFGFGVPDWVWWLALGFAGGGKSPLTRVNFASQADYCLAKTRPDDRTVLLFVVNDLELAALDFIS